MNDFSNKFLLTGDKFVPELNLRKPGFFYIACGPFTTHQKFKETCNLKHI